MNEELICELLASLKEEEAEKLLNAIKNLLTNEGEEDTLEDRIGDLFAYFKGLSNEYKSIFIFYIKSANKKANWNIESDIDEVNNIFQKYHIMQIIEEVNSSPIEFQNMFYDNIYMDIAPRYEVLKERALRNKRK